MKFKLLIAANMLVLMIVSAYVGYWYANTKYASLSGTNDNAGQRFGQNGANNIHTSAVRVGPPSLIKQQQALAIGVITQKTDSTITMRASDGTEATFTLTSNTLIYPLPAENGTPVMGTRNLSALVLNQKAAVTLDLVGAEYKVTTVAYIKQ